MLKCEKTVCVPRTWVILIFPDTGLCGQFSCKERIVFILLPVLAFMETYPQACGFSDQLSSSPERSRVPQAAVVHG